MRVLLLLQLPVVLRIMFLLQLVMVLQVSGDIDLGFDAAAATANTLAPHVLESVINVLFDVFELTVPLDRFAFAVDEHLLTVSVRLL